MFYDHNGCGFTTKVSMCKYWGVTTSCFDGRMARGWTLKDSLTTKSDEVLDHLGKEFSTVKDMCEYWCVKVTTFYKRKERGWSLESCLTGVHKSLRVYDHTGVGFTDTESMCKHWGVEVKEYKRRAKDNLPLKDCLDKDYVHIKEKYAVEDHMGTRYNNHTEMCESWGITRATFYNRQKAGYSLEECLEGRCKIKDHLGRGFKTYREMYKHWGVPYSKAMGLKHTFGLKASVITRDYGTNNQAGVA